MFQSVLFREELKEAPVDISGLSDEFPIDISGLSDEEFQQIFFPEARSGPFCDSVLFQDLPELGHLSSKEIQQVLFSDDDSSDLSNVSLEEFMEVFFSTESEC